ncbi:DUF3147 family protein [Pseudobacillus badius]|uniref:DUF3147 family protein n=1 Tax=Bacillus badius TaxID=1455 RepID=UPI0024A109C2|nr:DUF3147 family protein [Bacillus badius]GLY12030.1 hypothetical protein Bbad01_32460 [Bacillus badius]
MSFLVKTLISAVIIGAITMIAKASPKYGGIIAALPLVSLLSLFWLYVQGERPSQLSQFLFGVLYGLPSTMILIGIVAMALKQSLPFLGSLILGLGGWGVCLFLQKWLLFGSFFHLR